MLLFRRLSPSASCDLLLGSKSHRRATVALPQPPADRSRPSGQPTAFLNLSLSPGQSLVASVPTGHPSAVVHGPPIWPRGLPAPFPARFRRVVRRPRGAVRPLLAVPSPPRTMPPIATPPWRVPANGLPTSQCDETSMARRRGYGNR